MPPSTEDNRITNSLVDQGRLPEAQRENVPQQPASNVNMSELATQSESLTMPTPAPINADVRGTLSAGQEAVDAFSAQEQAKAAQAGQQYSASEQRLREQFGILGTESGTRQQLEGQAGVEGFSQDLQKFQQQLRRQMADLDQFDVDNVNTVEQMRVDASKRDITKRTFNAMSAEAGIQNAVQRANKVAATRATIAAVDITQGNLTAATNQVDKALNAIYEPVRMGIQMESQFLQNNLSLFTTAQTNAANARMKVLDQELNEINRAVSLTDSAVMSGYASGDDVEQLMGLANNPQAQASYAQQIVARGAIQERMLSQAAQRATISASVTSRRKNLLELGLMGDPGAIAELGFDPGAALREEEAALEAEEKAIADIAVDKEIDRLDGVMGDIESIIGNRVGLTTSSGQFRNATLSGFIGGQIMEQQAERGAVGKVVGTLPVVGNIVNSVAARQQKDDWLAQVGQVLTDQGFEALIDINERVRLTPITEMEVSLAFKSASALQNAARFEGEGENRRLVGFAMTEDKVQENFTNMYLSTQKVQEEAKAIQQFGYDGYVRLQQLQQTANQ